MCTIFYFSKKTVCSEVIMSWLQGEWSWQIHYVPWPVNGVNSVTHLPGQFSELGELCHTFTLWLPMKLCFWLPGQIEWQIDYVQWPVNCANSGKLANWADYTSHIHSVSTNQVALLVVRVIECELGELSVTHLQCDCQWNCASGCQGNWVWIGQIVEVTYSQCGCKWNHTSGHQGKLRCSCCSCPLVTVDPPPRAPHLSQTHFGTGSILCTVGLGWKCLMPLLWELMPNVAASNFRLHVKSYADSKQSPYFKIYITFSIMISWNTIQHIVEYTFIFGSEACVRFY